MLSYIFTFWRIPLTLNCMRGRFHGTQYFVLRLCLFNATKFPAEYFCSRSTLYSWVLKDCEKINKSTSLLTTVSKKTNIAWTFSPENDWYIKTFRITENLLTLVNHKCRMRGSKSFWLTHIKIAYRGTSIVYSTIGIKCLTPLRRTFLWFFPIFIFSDNHTILWRQEFAISILQMVKTFLF